MKTAKQELKQHFRIMCRKKTDPLKWTIKAICPELWQAQKFIAVLETASNLYIEFKIEPVQIKEGGNNNGKPYKSIRN